MRVVHVRTRRLALSGASLGKTERARRAHRAPREVHSRMARTTLQMATLRKPPYPHFTKCIASCTSAPGPCNWHLDTRGHHTPISDLISVTACSPMANWTSAEIAQVAKWPSTCQQVSTLATRCANDKDRHFHTVHSAHSRPPEVHSRVVHTAIRSATLRFPAYPHFRSAFRTGCFHFAPVFSIQMPEFAGMSAPASNFVRQALTVIRQATPRANGRFRHFPVVHVRTPS